MIRSYRYELWDGKKSVGEYVTTRQLFGKYLIVPEQTILKHRYGSVWKEIKVPIIVRVVSDDGVDYTVRRVLDIRRKSKRQIDFLKSF